MLFHVNSENMSAIINNFSQHMIGLFFLQTKGSVFIAHKNDRWLTQLTLEWLVNKLTNWMNVKRAQQVELVWNIFQFRDVILKVEKI